METHSEELFKVWIGKSSDNSPLGSGVLFVPRTPAGHAYVLTAGHVIYDALSSGEEIIIYLNNGIKKEGILGFKGFLSESKGTTLESGMCLYHKKFSRVSTNEVNYDAGVIAIDYDNNWMKDLCNSFVFRDPLSDERGHLLGFPGRKHSSDYSLMNKSEEEPYEVSNPGTKEDWYFQIRFSQLNSEMYTNNMQEYLEGTSGGGTFHREDDCLYLSGIFSKSYAVNSSSHLVSKSSIFVSIFESLGISTDLESAGIKHNRKTNNDETKETESQVLIKDGYTSPKEGESIFSSKFTYEKEKLIGFWKNKGLECETYVNELRESGFVPFIGSGMSVSYKYSSWSDFLRKRIDKVNDLSIRKQLKKNHSSGKYFDLIESLMNVSDEDLYNSIKTNYGSGHILSDNNSYIKTLQSKNIKQFITTNYDTVIEDLYHLSKTQEDSDLDIILPDKLNNIEEVKQEIIDETPCVIKLFGTYDKKDSLILTKDQYDKFHANNIFNTLKTIMPQKPLLLMGCSLVKDCLYYDLLQESKEHPYTWDYVIIMEPQSDNRLRTKTSELMRLGLKPIWFPYNGFDSINTILTLLCSERSSAYIENEVSREEITSFSDAFSNCLDRIAKEAPVEKRSLLFSTIMNFQRVRNTDNYDGIVDMVIRSHSNCPLIIEGVPGTGKSTLLSLIYQSYCERCTNIYPAYIDLQRFTSPDIKEYDFNTIVSKIDAVVKAQKRVVIFIDGFNRYQSTNKEIERILLGYIDEWKQYKSVQFCYAIGVVDLDDEDIFQNNENIIKLNTSDCEKRIYLSKIEVKDLNPIVKSLLSFYGIYNKSDNEVLEYLERNNSAEIDYKELSESERKQRYIDSITDSFEMFCKKVTPDMIEFRTVNLLANYLSVNSPDVLKQSIAEPFDEHYMRDTERGARTSIAREITYYWLRIGSERSLPNRYKEILYKNSTVRYFVVAKYIYDMLLLPDIGKIDEINKIFTNGINRFLIDVVCQNKKEEETIVRNIISKFDSCQVNTRNQLAYILGRVRSEVSIRLANSFLEHQFSTRRYSRLKSMSIDDYKLLRTVGVSLIYLGNNKYTKEFYELLLYDHKIRIFNRNFHIKYFFSSEYDIEDGSLLENITYDKKLLEKLWHFLFHSVFIETSSNRAVGLNLITMLDIIQLNTYILKGELNNNQYIDLMELYKKLEKEDIEIHEVIKRFMISAIKDLRNTDAYLKTMNSIYKTKDVIRGGWIESDRSVNVCHPAESVADHSWACCMIAEMFLTEDIDDCYFMNKEDKSKYKSEYNKSTIIRILLSHDVAEIQTGDIPSQKMTEEMLDKQKECVHDLMVASTLPQFQGLYYVGKRWFQFAEKIYEGVNINVKLAYEIDKMEPLFQLYVYKEELLPEKSISIKDEWIKTVEDAFVKHNATSFGNNMLNWIKENILDSRHYTVNKQNSEENNYTEISSC